MPQVVRERALARARARELQHALQRPMTVHAPTHAGLQERQQPLGVMPGLKPGMQTCLKHFTPLHETGAVGAIFVAYGLGPFMATCLSTATTWSGAKHTGQTGPCSA